jgi:Ca2+-binding EF-hand superfamily protein
LFAFYDQDNNGWIDFHEFCCGLSILTKGNRDEKITPAFNGFDLENCGYIRRQDFRRMFKAYFFVTVELVRDVVRACEDEMLEGFEDDPSKPVSAIFNAPIPTRPHSSGDMSPGNKPPLPPGTPGLIARRQESGIWPVLEVVSQDAVEELVEMVMSGADTNSDGRVSFEEFANYVLVDPTVLAWLDALGPVF